VEVDQVLVHLPQDLVEAVVLVLTDLFHLLQSTQT
jgi:hypothetical protein